MNCFPRSLGAFESRRAGPASNPDLLEILRTEVESGHLEMPEMAIRYTLRGASAQGTVPLAVLQVPFATARSTGLSTEPDHSRAWLMSEGSVMAHVMLPGHSRKPIEVLMKASLTCLCSILFLLAPGSGSAQSPANRGVELAELSWLEAEEVLTPESVIVLPLGAAAKEHGPHLRLDNDLQMAEYLKRRVLAAADVVVAPTVSYHFYPSFLEYPGSTHLRFETSRDLIVDIVRSLAGYGPRRFYVLNTGVSTLRPLQASADILLEEGILLHFTNILEVAGPAEARVREQVRGTHADEIETSMMLYIAPDRVDMSLAVREDNPNRRGGLTRRVGGPGTYSASGVWGDATLATIEKGRAVVEAAVDGILRDIDALRAAELPGDRQGG